MQTRHAIVQLAIAVAASMLTVACTQAADPPAAETSAPAPASDVPQSLEMGGSRSVMSFFITSQGPGRGGDLGGLAGADAHCQALAAAEGAGDRRWHAYLSASASPGQAAVHARDRIGNGPWYNAEGLLIAADLEQLHSDANKITKETAVTQKLDPVNGVGDTPNMHDILTGTRPDGRAFDGAQDLTCGNWTSSGDGSAQVGHHDRRGQAEGLNSWNSVHASRGCSQESLQATGGAGLFYCFAID